MAVFCLERAFIARWLLGSNRSRAPMRSNPPQLNVDTRLRLARLLGMTGSAHDGEVVNAARLADRLVRENGLTWRDVVAPVGCASVPQPEDVSIDIRRDWRHTAQWCLSQGGHVLRDKDRDFLHTIAGYRHCPSDAQLVWLHGLVRRTIAAGGAP
jgi:hypothetical protein